MEQLEKWPVGAASRDDDSATSENTPPTSSLEAKPAKKAAKATKPSAAPRESDKKKSNPLAAAFATASAMQSSKPKPAKEHSPAAVRNEARSNEAENADEVQFDDLLDMGGSRIQLGKKAKARPRTLGEIARAQVVSGALPIREQRARAVIEDSDEDSEDETSMKDDREMGEPASHDMEKEADSEDEADDESARSSQIAKPPRVASTSSSGAESNFFGQSS